MIDFSKFDSLIQVMGYFTDDSRCRSVIEESRWGGDVICPYCGHHHCRRGYRGRFVCPECQNKFSCTVGTIFENTKVSLRKWFIAIYLIAYHKKGISSCQLAKDISVTQKTAWYMLQKIRTLFIQKEPQMEGEVELDEVYVGGKEYFKHKSRKVSGTKGRSVKTKTPVFGMMDRSGGKVYAIVVPCTDRHTLLPIVAHICKQGSQIYTDELASYDPLDRMGYIHKVVSHGYGQYVRGHSHTNTIEGYWGHFKRMITGTYHNISKDHLQRYVDESVFRWNHRNFSCGRIFRILMGRSIKIVPYSAIRSTGI